MRRTLWQLAALAVVALIGAGCSSESGGGGDKAANDAMKFAECMRDNGVREFPDPPASGRLTIDAIANGSSLDTTTPAWKAALGACKDLQPAGFMGTKVSAAQQRERLEFAQCIRDNGVKDFPDPANGAPLVDTNRIPSSAEPGGMDILNAAMRKCRDAGARALGRQ